jgi:FkbM family methyltransferase
VAKAAVRNKRVNLVQALDQALTLHHDGKFDEAARQYAAVLKVEPRNFDALHLLGIARFQQGRHAEAIERVKAALKLQPSNAEALSNLGLILAQMNRSEEAVATYDKALATRPDQTGVLYSRGNSLALLRRLEEALQSFDKALALQPDYPEALNNRGAVLRDLKRPEEALASYDKALALRPDYPEALNNRGIALGDLKRSEEALESYDRALALQPGYFKALNNRGNTLLDLKRLEDALANFDEALAVNPDYAEALNNRGIALRDLERPEEALASYDRAVALRPDYPEAWNNRGNALKDLMRFDEALASYERAYAIRPDYADARYNRGLAHLSIGDFAAGWEGYEYRWDREGSPPKKLAVAFPPWQGEDLRGKRLVVYEEQGLGDVIQFARYLPVLKAQGASITFLTRRILHRLLQPLAPFARITDQQPFGEAHDYQCALMSLPAILGTTLDNIPAEVPYLAAEEAVAAAWRQRLGSERFRIGIAWQGNPSGRVDIGRSLPLSSFRPLAAIPGVRLISLQKTHGLDQLTALPEGMTVETLGDDFDSGPDAFVDSAAVIANLDLVVTSDTAVAHLAGAMGRPVWVALKYSPDWRWPIEREDSPWYPTMRLFHQQRAGDWGEVFQRIAAAVAERVDRFTAELDAGLALHRDGKLDEAAQLYTKILAKKPDHFDALHLLGVVRTQQGKPAEGVAKITAALALKSGSPEALTHLGLALERTGCCEEALASHDRALALRPDFPEALNNRGNALRLLQRPQEALASYERALALRPDYAEGFNNRGNALQDLLRTVEARASYDKALELRPDYPAAHFGRGVNLLMAGEYAEGWPEYDWRWKGGSKEKLQAPHLTGPLWQGEDLAGKTILLYSEQGLGDTIQFVRFAPALAALGARVVIAVPQRLLGLLRGIPGPVTLVAGTDKLPPFDYHLPLLNVAAALGVTVDTLPGEPYLAADPERVAKWRRRPPQDGFRIGIAWQGNPKADIDLGRSPPLRCFAPLAAVPGVRLISLQKRDGVDQLDRLPAGMQVTTLGEDFDAGPDAFHDTAAVMANLDLVITSDTAIPHLAGALGRPVWVALKYLPDWRWMLGREDSPWYPTARLFRQRRLGDWDDVFARVAAELAAVVHGEPERLQPQMQPPQPQQDDPGATLLKECRHGRMLFLKRDRYIGRSLEVYGEFSEREAEVFAQLVRPGDVVVEVGANIGAHTVYLAKLVGRGGAVLAFEPQRVIHQLLCANLGLNELFHVRAYHGAVGREAGRIRVPPLDYSEANNFGGLELADGGANGEVVQLWRLDDFALPALRLLKADVEGMEIDVLEGARRTIAQHRPVIYVENDRRERSEELITLIDSLAYDLWWHRPPLFNPDNFAGHAENIFGRIVSTNLLCLPKEANSSIAGLRPVSGPKDRP